MLVSVSSKIRHDTIPMYDCHEKTTIPAFSCSYGGTRFKVPIDKTMKVIHPLSECDFVVCCKSGLDCDTLCDMDYAEKEVGVQLSPFKVTNMFPDILRAMAYLESIAHGLQCKWTMHTLGDLWPGEWKGPLLRPRQVDVHGNEWVPRVRTKRQHAGTKKLQRKRRRRAEPSDDEDKYDEEQKYDDAFYNEM